MNRFNLTPGKPDPMGPPGLARYGSAPGSLLTSIADSVVNSQARPRADLSLLGSEPIMSRFFPGDSSDSSCRPGSSPDPRATAAASYAFAPLHAPIPDLSGPHKPPAAPPVAPLVRHSSSPAGLLSHLLVDPQGTLSLARTCDVATSDLLCCLSCPLAVNVAARDSLLLLVLVPISFLFFSLFNF